MPRTKDTEEHLEQIMVTLLDAIIKKAGADKARMLTADVASAVTDAYELGLEEGHDDN
jgi:hypothetical protein